MVDLKKLVGVKVRYAGFREGTIQEITNGDTIWVSFPNEGRLHGYKLPLALAIIQCDEPNFVEFVEKIKRENYTCSICGIYDLDIRKEGNQKLCNQCYKSAPKCAKCSKRVSVESFSYKKQKFCLDCFDKMYFKCDLCGEYQPISMKVQSKRVPKRVQWCEKCMSRCDLCNALIPTPKVRFILLSSGRRKCLCSTCADVSLLACAECGEIFFRGKEIGEVCGKCVVRNSFIDQLSKMKFSQLSIEKWDFCDFKYRKTIDVMSKLNSTHKTESIDILLITYTNGHDLVIIHEKSDLFNPVVQNVMYEDLTLTRFKESRLFDYLVYENIPILTTQVWSPNRSIEVWKEPICIRAKTYGDMDYRKEWSGDTLYYEGNNYGDTSVFYAIGVVRSSI